MTNKEFVLSQVNKYLERIENTERGNLASKIDWKVYLEDFVKQTGYKWNRIDGVEIVYSALDEIEETPDFDKSYIEENLYGKSGVTLISIPWK